MGDDKKLKKGQPGGKGSFTDLGLLPPDDPVYSTGLIVSGRKVVLPEKQDEATQSELKVGKGSHTSLGFSQPDDPVYSTELQIAGRPFPPNTKK